MSAQTWFSNVKQSPTANSCAINWTTAVPTIGHIEYGQSAGSYTNTTSNGNTFSTSTMETISGLTAGTTYHFRIVASDISKDWITSLDSVCMTASAAAAQHSVKLNWLPSTSTGVTGYRIFRSTISGGYYGLLASAGGLTYTDKNVQSGATYYYVVQTVNSAGQQSKYSNQVKAAVP